MKGLGGLQSNYRIWKNKFQHFNLLILVSWMKFLIGLLISSPDSLVFASSFLDPRYIIKSLRLQINIQLERTTTDR